MPHGTVGLKNMYIIASSIIYTSDIDKKQNSILNTPLFHTLASNFPPNRHGTMVEIGEKNQ